MAIPKKGSPMVSNAIHPTEIQSIPHEVGILPLRDTVAYPYMVLPLAVAQPSAIKLIEDAVGRQPVHRPDRRQGDIVRWPPCPGRCTK